MYDVRVILSVDLSPFAFHLAKNGGHGWVSAGHIAPGKTDTAAERGTGVE